MNVIDKFFQHLSLTNGITSWWHLIDTTHLHSKECGMCAFSLMFGNDSRCFVCVCVFLSFLPSAVARIMSILPEKFSQFSKLGEQLLMLLMLTSFYSGTTWVQEIIWEIYNEGVINSEHMSKRVPFLETATSGMYPDLVPGLSEERPRQRGCYTPTLSWISGIMYQELTPLSRIKAYFPRKMIGRQLI